MTHNHNTTTSLQIPDDDAPMGQGQPAKRKAPRKSGWFMVDNEFFRGGQAAELGPAGATVYLAILMHADNTTRDAHPSYTALQHLTGLSRTTVIKQVRELASRGLIHVEPRYEIKHGKRRQTSHLYTILDGKGLERYTDPDLNEEGQEGASGARTVSRKVQQSGMSGQGTEPGMVKPLYQDSQSDGLGVVQPEYQGGTCAVPKHHSGNNTQKEQDPRQQHQPSLDVVDVRVLLSSETWISEDRSLTKAERARLMKTLAWVLLRAVVSEFHNARQYVKGLDAHKIDRLGTLVLWLSRFDLLLELHLKRPAGFVRSVIENDEWEEPQDYDEMPIMWSEFCDMMTEVARVLVTKDQLLFWFASNSFNADIVFAIEEAGFAFKPNDTPAITPDVDDSHTEDSDWDDEDLPF